MVKNMNEKTKYKIGDKVYINYNDYGILIFVKWKISKITKEYFIDNNKNEIDIIYSFVGKGDKRHEEDICCIKESDVIKQINKYYDKEIVEINKKRKESIEKFKDR